MGVDTSNQSFEPAPVVERHQIVAGPKAHETLEAIIKGMVFRIGILTAVILGLQASSTCRAQSTGPYIPHLVTIVPKTNALPIFVTVLATLPAPSPCFYITNWGQPVMQGKTISADAQFWQSGLVPCPTVLSGASTQYNLGWLPPGDYRFVFGAWGTTIKTQAFSVPVLVAISMVQSNSQFRVCWNTATNAWYRLECRSTLANDWTPLTAWLAGDGNSFCTNDTILPGQPQKFFRVASTNSP